MNPHTPSFPVELQNKDPDDVILGFRRQKEISDEKLDKVLQEAFENRITVGSDHSTPIYNTTNPVQKWGWCPHNYRVYFNFNKTKFNPNKTAVNTAVGCGWKLINHNKEALLKNYKGCNILIKKKMVEVTNLIHDKQVWQILASTLEEATNFKEYIKRIYDHEAKQALASCIMEYGGESDFQIIRVDVRDNEVRDDIIDKFPANMRIDTEHFKKWYSNKTEIKGINKTIRYMHNRIIEPILPELNAVNIEIGERLNKIERLISPKSFLISKIKTFQDYINASQKYPSEYLQLSCQDRNEIVEHIFKLKEGQLWKQTII